MITTPLLYHPVALLANLDTFNEKVSVDPYLFASLYVLISPLVSNIVQAEELDMPRVKELKSLVDKIDNNLNAKPHSSILTLDEEPLKLLSELKKQLGDRVTAQYVDEFLLGLKAQKILSRSQREQYVEHALCTIGLLGDSERIARMSNSGITMRIPFEENIDRLLLLLQVTAKENEGYSDMLRVSFLVATNAAFSIFYKYLELSVGGNAGLMLEIAEGMTSEESVLPSNPLLKFNICSFSEHYMRFHPMSEWWVQTLMSETRDDFDRRFIKPLETEVSYKGSLARVTDEDAKLITNLINKHDDEEGCNLLMYGPANLDGRGAFIDIIESAGISKHVFELSDSARSSSLSAVVAVAQQLIDHDQILLVDNADKALSRGYRDDSYFYEVFGRPEPKKNDELTTDGFLLSKNMPVTVWISSNVTRISADALARFLVHAEIKPASRAVKETAIKKMTESLRLSDETKQKLLNYQEISVEQLKAAQKTSMLLGITDEAQFLASIEASQKAMGRDSASEELRESVTKYDLDLLNLETRYSVSKVIEGLKKRGAGTLCFHGMPGTGKTQLAEYIAIQLNKPLLVKRASDILSKWLGEAEQNIAKAFEEAKTQGAVLLMDECDSFLRDRALSKNSWELTMVNELLQRMERFPGVFICATNLMDQIDAAALRRFTFKFKFRALDTEQRIRMFKNETGVDIHEEHPLFLKLTQIQYLTPGDFATVQRQLKIFDDVLTPEQWLVELDRESKIKLGGLVRQNVVSDLSDLDVLVKER